MKNSKRAAGPLSSKALEDPPSNSTPRTFILLGWGTVITEGFLAWYNLWRELTTFAAVVLVLIVLNIIHGSLD